MKTQPNWHIVVSMFNVLPWPFPALCSFLNLWISEQLSSRPIFSTSKASKFWGSSLSSPALSLSLQNKLAYANPASMHKYPAIENYFGSLAPGYIFGHWTLTKRHLVEYALSRLALSSRYLVAPPISDF